MEAGGFLPTLVLPLDLIKGFSIIIARHTSLKREIERAFLILELEKTNPLQTSKRLKCCKKKAYCLYHRTKEFIEYFESMQPITDGATERLIRSFLKDNERSGAPLIYSPEQQCAIVVMASEKPKKYGIEADRWTHHELAMVANRDGITSSISPSTVGRILNEADIKPHRIRFVYTDFTDSKLRLSTQ